MLIGVISDTHGLLRPEALAAFAGVDHILHAGDVGSDDILLKLKEIAFVTAIRGNVDTRGDCAQLPAIEAVELGRVWFYLVHSVHDLDIDPVAGGFGVVVSGHSHHPGMERRGSVLYLNPGSAGPRRFKLPVTIALVRIENESAGAKIVPLDIPPA